MTNLSGEATPKASTGRRVLIAGASGMIGAALIRCWMQGPTRVVRLVRHQDGQPAPAVSGEAIVWDPLAAQPIVDMSRLGGVDAVVCLSGANVAGHRWTQEYKQEIVSSRVQSARAVAAAITQLDPPPQVLICSSAIGIYGDRGDEILTEDSASGSGFLAGTCVAWEAAARTAEDAGIRVVHVRFGVVLSPEGGALGKLLPLFRLGLGGNLGNGRQWMPWLSLRDALGIVQFCLDNETVRGPVNAVTPIPLTNAEFTQSLATAVHRPAVLPAPGFALRLAFGEMANETLLASVRVLPTKLIGAGYQFADPQIAPALRAMLS
jgi:uncharacterized protein